MLVVVSLWSAAPDYLILALQKRIVFRTSQCLIASMSKQTLLPTELARFTTALYTLWLYILTPADSRPSYLSAHTMPDLLRCHDIARKLYSMQVSGSSLSSFFGGEDRAWKHGLEGFLFNEWLHLVEQRLDADGFFDPTVVERPLQGVQEPQLCWTLLDEYQDYVERVRLREDMKAGRANWKRRIVMVRADSI